VAFAGEPFEAVEVELVGLQVEDVAGGTGLEPAVAERLAQLRDRVLEDLRRRRRRPAVPELVDQPLARQQLVRVQQHEDQERLLLAPVQRDRPVLPDDLERAQDAKFHRRPPNLTVAPWVAGA